MIIAPLVNYNIWLIIAADLMIVATAFLAGISVLAMGCIWWERKAAGHMQCRLGPKHVGPFGLLQSVADGVKLILKEDLMPSGADEFLFRLAPYLAFAPVFAAFLALPFGPQFVFESRLSIGVLYLFAVLAVEVMGVILAGWGSNSKWAVYGAMREACQMVSYEIPLGISVICGVIVAGTLHLSELSYLQGAGMHDWFIFHNPFIFVAFILYFVASLASNKRAPFDLPESESELVAGFHTEYSGLRFSFFFFAEYAAMFVIGGIQAALFLGGWNSPFGAWDPVYHAIGYDPVAAGSAYFSGSVEAARGWTEVAQAMGVSAVGLGVVNAYGMFWFCVKAAGVIFIQMWLRWTLPRIRIDQVMHACVKVLLPMSLVTLCGTAVWVGLVDVIPATASQAPSRIRHLVSDGTLPQVITQYVLMGATLLFLASCVVVVVAAFVNRSQPRKTLFDDIMPVGNEISFTKTPPPPALPVAPAPAASTAAEPAAAAGA